MKEFEREKARLRRLVADLSLVSQVLADVASGNLQPPNDAGRHLLQGDFVLLVDQAAQERLVRTKLQPGD